jgi:hypothetical protein
MRQTLQQQASAGVSKQASQPHTTSIDPQMFPKKNRNKLLTRVSPNVHPDSVVTTNHNPTQLAMPCAQTP